jgi:hypothetical protein
VKQVAWMRIPLSKSALAEQHPFQQRPSTNSVISTVTVPTTITDTGTTTTTLTQETTATFPMSTTIMVPNPLCTSYKFVVANGERANQYLQDRIEAPSYYDYIGF